MNDVIDEAAEFLKEKLSAHSDGISIEQFQYLLNQDQHNLLILKAIEYAKDSNVDLQNFKAMEYLTELVGQNIDSLQDRINENKNIEQQEIILQDLQMIHFGLIGLNLVNKCMNNV